MNTVHLYFGIIFDYNISFNVCKITGTHGKFYLHCILISRCYLHVMCLRKQNLNNYYKITKGSWHSAGNQQSRLRALLQYSSVFESGIVQQIFWHVWVLSSVPFTPNISFPSPSQLFKVCLLCRMLNKKKYLSIPINLHTSAEVHYKHKLWFRVM